MRTDPTPTRPGWPGENKRVHLLNADLHSHSRYSDGTLSPSALAARAAANAVDLWALTDHDETRGLAEAAEAAQALGLDFVNGVEISVSFAGETVHIVGLGFDAGNATLQAGLARTRGGRTVRAQAMADGLAAVGLQGAFDGALRYVSNPDLVSRTHFARWLVETGVCADTGSVFRRYLTDGKPGRSGRLPRSVRLSAGEWKSLPRDAIRPNSSAIALYLAVSAGPWLPVSTSTPWPPWVLNSENSANSSFTENL